MTNNFTPLDDLDFDLLQFLQRDGRMSFTDLAQRLEVSVSTVRNRVTRLIEEDTLAIIGRVNPTRTGFHAYAQVLISVRPVTLVNEIAQQLMTFPEVSFLAMTTGMNDLEINLMCRDNDHLTDTLRKIHQIEGVFETKTNMYFNILKLTQPDLSLVRSK
jgi:Lrp/AsnC family transcriptional regulator, regulator for asnA, asnC and gidA